MSSEIRTISDCIGVADAYWGTANMDHARVEVNIGSARLQGLTESRFISVTVPGLPGARVRQKHRVP
jgi:hypothetical protein